MIVAANPRAARWLGLAASVLVGRAISDFLPPSATTASPFPGVHPPLETRLRRPDGTESLVTIEVSSLDDRRRVIFLRDRQQQETRLNRVNAVLLNLGDDFERNVQLLTAAGGELLEADCALYNRLDGELLCAKGQWQTPPGFKAEDAPEGHLCYDVIRQASNEPRVVAHLQETAYVKTDPNVAAYGLRTYLGCPVRFGGKNRGSLCVVYRRDYQPSADDRRILGLLAAAIGQDEERTRAMAALRVKDWAIEASIAAIALSDRAGRLTYVNGAFLTMWGYAELSEVLGRLATEFWDVRGQAEQVIAALVTKGSWVGEMNGRRKDGATFCVQLFATQVKDTAGEPIGMVGSFVDLTERQHTQEQLRASEERLANVVNTVPDGITQVDRAGRIVFANTAAEQILRLSRRDITQRTYDDPSWKITTLDGQPFPHDDLPFVRVMRTGRPVANVQHAIEHPDGTRAFLSINAAPVRDGAGAPDGMVASITDITDRKRTEDAMRDNEERLRLALAGTSQGLFDLNLQTGQATFTPEYATMLGYDPAGFRLDVGSWTEMLHPDEREHALATLGACVAGKTRAYSMECRLRTQAGDWAWVLSSGKVVACDSAGRPSRLIGVHFNITERKQAEAALRENEYFLAKSQEIARLGSYKLEIAKGHWVATPELDRIFGIDATYPRTVEAWTRLVAPDQRDAMAEYFATHVVGGRNRFEREYRIVRPSDGQERWVFGIGELEFDAAGQPIRMIGTIQDITERMRADHALRASEARLAEVFANMDDIVFLLNVQDDGRLVYESFNPRCEQITGLKSSEVCGRSPDEVLPPENAAILMPRYRACRDSGQVMHYESELTYAPGRRNWSTTLVPIRDEHGRVYRIAGFGRDITERQKAEQDRLELERRLLHAQKLESLGILAGGIAHDFNNLLMGILGNLDLALMDLSPVSPARSSIQQSVLAARRAAELTRQMLAYSGRGSFIIRRLNLNDLVEENAHLFRACISKLVTLDVETAADLPRIKADPGQIQQVVMNLITNASESIGNRPGVVHLRTGAVDCDDATLRRSRADGIPPAGRFVFLEVVDTGCGMDEGTQQRLFDPFFTTKFTGRGLGMSALLGIVRGHHGAIFVESTVGQGTTIRVLFPAEMPAMTAATVAAARPPGQPSAAAPSGAILVVDDEDIVRRVCSYMLAKHGWRVLEAADGLQAIDIVRRQAADIACVVLDLSMPHMGGIEVFHALRLLRPDLPIILSSGYSNDQGASKQLTTEGLAGFIQKPYTTEALLGELERALKRP